MSRTKPSRYESYMNARLDSDHERKWLFPIVVHGTTFGREPGSWYKRVATGRNYPFCAKLTKQLKMFGVPFPVWLNCDELDMTEFQWSGLNDHHARLQAGLELAKYINTCHNRCVEKLGEKPVFILIGHSHGGNVILASLGLLQPEIAVAGIYLMGTPFFLYTERPRREKREDGRETDISVYRNIYLSAPVCCPFYCYNASFENEIDEVHGVFSFLQLHRYFQGLARGAMLRLSERPQAFVIDDYPIADFKLFAFGDTLLDMGYLESRGIYPSRRERFKMRLRYLQALASWPFRWLAIHAVTPIAERAWERKVFRLFTGLDPVLFKPENTRVSP